MKILYLSKSIIPSRTANSVHVMKMCEALANCGHEVTLIGVKGPDYIDDQSAFDYYGTGRVFETKLFETGKTHGVYNLLYGIKLLGLVLKTGKPDLAYGRHLLGMLVMSLFRGSFMYESHSAPFSSKSKLLERILYKRPGFKKLIVISKALKNIYLEEISELQSDQVVVAHDCADIPDDIKPTGHIGGRNNSLQVGYVGHLYKGRGMDLIGKMAESLKDMDFHIVGGENSDIEYWKRELSLSNVFFHGFIPHGELSSYFIHFDIVLAPYEKKVSISGDEKADTSRWMSPLKIFEYMSFGKALVVSDIEVLREILGHEQNALLVEPGNADEWIKALIKLKEIPQLRKQISLEAKKTHLENYTWDSRANNIMNLVSNSH